MIGREAMSNPMVFSDKVPDLKEKKALFGEYMKLAERYDKCIEIGILRLKAINFMTGVPNAAQLRDDICRVKTVENIVELIENY
jgi:tRNA-dihydrouridine synthase